MYLLVTSPGSVPRLQVVLAIKPPNGKYVTCIDDIPMLVFCGYFRCACGFWDRFGTALLFEEFVQPRANVPNCSHVPHPKTILKMNPKDISCFWLFQKCVDKSKHLLESHALFSNSFPRSRTANA